VHVKAVGASSKPVCAAGPTNKAPGTGMEATRRQSARGGPASGGGVGGCGDGGGGEVPKKAQLTEFVVAQAPSGRKRCSSNSSAEAFLPAGLPCFVT
jgi:hypothetical protein